MTIATPLPVIGTNPKDDKTLGNEMQEEVITVGGVLERFPHFKSRDLPLLAFEWKEQFSVIFTNKFTVLTTVWKLAYTSVKPTESDWGVNEFLLPFKI